MGMCIEYSFYENVELQKKSSILCIDKEGNLIINLRNVILGSIKRKKNNSTIFGLEKAGSLQEKPENRRGSVFV